MKKKILPVLLLLCSLFPGQLKADEGMWTLYNLPQAIYQQMISYGYNLPYGALFYGDNALKNSVVNFSGYCTGVIVSPDGLVFTNHHCGFESIRSHSTVDHDYMKNGFYAKTFEEELPNENMFVSCMIDQKDITQKLQPLHLDAQSRERQEMILDSLENALSDSVKSINKHYHVQIDPFYEGNKYYATTYQDFTDLRLVFSVPKSMGKFGGDTDNWMWPRQTCDFSVFRIYADPETNGPAEYSKDNVPYHPNTWAQVSIRGYEDGDFAMTLGYPGSTERYLSSYGIKEMKEAKNAPRIEVRGIKQGIMTKHMIADDAVRIKYDSKYAQSSNYWKNSIGMNKCIDSINLINDKKNYEDKIQAWQNSTGYLKGKLDFDKMSKYYAERFNTIKTMTYFTETFVRTTELTSRAMMANMMQPKGSKDNPKQQYITFEDNSDTWDAALDKEVLSSLLENYRKHVPANDQPDFYRTIDRKFHGNYKKYVDYLFDKSVLMKSGKKIHINRKSFKKDLGVQFGKDLLSFITQKKHFLKPINEQIDKQEKYLCDAKIRMEEDMPHYSDANFTMRLSYGKVGGFTLNGKPSGFYTNPASIIAKMEQGEQNRDYKVQPVMKELLGAKDFGRYADKTTGEMHLCFITNNDITGGNSGSPMFDKNGKLIGLAFDGNWDSLSSDIKFDSRLARCIGVDIRYVLFMMDKWGKADRLIKEINPE